MPLRRAPTPHRRITAWSLPPRIRTWQVVQTARRRSTRPGLWAWLRTQACLIASIAAGPPAPPARPPRERPRTHARSTTLARRASRPVRGQGVVTEAVHLPAAAWRWAATSRGDGYKGMRKRRRKANCMASDDSVVAASVGMAVNHAPGPACERSSPVAGWQGWQQNAVAKVEVACTRRGALPTRPAALLLRGRALRRLARSPPPPASSCASAYGVTSCGGTVRREWWARWEAHMASSSQACVSGRRGALGKTRGMRKQHPCANHSRRSAGLLHPAAAAAWRLGGNARPLLNSAVAAQGSAGKKSNLGCAGSTSAAWPATSLPRMGTVGCFGGRRLASGAVLGVRLRCPQRTATCRWPMSASSQLTRRLAGCHCDEALADRGRRGPRLFTCRWKPSRQKKYNSDLAPTCQVMDGQPLSRILTGVCC